MSSQRRRIFDPKTTYDIVAGPRASDLSFEEAMFRAGILQAAEGRHVIVGLKAGASDGSNGYYKDGSVEVPGDVHCQAFGHGGAAILDLEVVTNTAGGSGRRSFEGVSVLQTSERPAFRMDNASFALVKWLRCFLTGRGTTNPTIDILGNSPIVLFDEVQADVWFGNPHGAIRQDGGRSEILNGCEFFHNDFDTHTSETLSGTMNFRYMKYDGVVRSVGGLTFLHHCLIDAFQVGAGRPGTFARVGAGATLKMRRNHLDGADGVSNPVFDGIGASYGTIDRDEMPMADFAGATITHASLTETIHASV